MFKERKLAGNCARFEVWRLSMTLIRHPPAGAEKSNAGDPILSICSA
jgi:hypothetical protein